MTSTNSSADIKESGAAAVLPVFLHYHKLLASKNPPEKFMSACADLEAALASLGAFEASAALDRLARSELTEESLELAWTKLFVRGAVPPYETSHMPPNMTGHLAEMADLAGFYRAFGVEVQGERPDHLLAELEFMTFLLFKYADAFRAARKEEAELTADAAGAFLEEHFGTWIEQFAKRVSTDLPDSPYEPVIASLAEFVNWLCEQTGISPRPIQSRSAGLPLTNPFGPADSDDESELPGCFGCPLPGDREIDIPG